MSGDLGANPHEVHDAFVHDAFVHDGAREVLDFWFDEVPPDKWFAKDDALDAAIADRFARIRDDVLESDAVGWRANAQTLLAAVIALDQFSRNLFRGNAEAFAGDALALDLARDAIDKGWDKKLTPEQRVFLYMPLTHAENNAAQSESVRLFQALGIAENLKFAREHADVIARFGRFPARNAALGRKTSDEEAAFMAQGGADW